MLRPQRGDRGADDFSGVLSRHASELYKDARLNPMLQQLIRTSCQLGDAMGGSVSLVDVFAGSYTKIAEVGTACRLGQSFPLSEGVTGEVLKRRAPVVLRTYRDLRSGHLKAGHPAADGAVAAIPIWWRADIVAVNVIFAGVARAFTTGEIDHLELITQVVAPGLVTAVERELPGRSSARRPVAVELTAADVGATAALDSVTDVVAGLIELTHCAGSPAHSPVAGLQVRVVGNVEHPRLLFRPEAEGAVCRPGTDMSWHELVDTPTGVVAVAAAAPAEPQRRRPRASGVDASASPDSTSPDATSPDAVGPDSAGPFSTRERQVATLLCRGLSDRDIANRLFLSPKTVEKHVSAVLRKTNTTSRTAAVVRCLDSDWV